MRSEKETLLIECLDEIEDGMSHISETRDIWQHRLLYALCAAVRLLVINAIAEERKKLWN